MAKRSLYQCLRAKVKNDRIYCAKGRLLAKAKDGSISILALVRGEPLEMAVCQKCDAYDEMGPPVAPADRGWVHLIVHDEIIPRRGGRCINYVNI